MLRVRYKSRKAITLIELVVAMALTAIFAVACVMLILPVSQIYTHHTELSRAQLVADNVAACLRAACTGNKISQKGDVWIASSGNIIYTADDGNSITSSLDKGSVLVIRKSPEYCMTIASNYEINGKLYNEVMHKDVNESDTTYSPETDNNGLTSRAIYRMFNGIPATDSVVASGENRVHLGYYSAGVSNSNYVFPIDYYDYTDPITNAVYGGYDVELEFSELQTDIETGAPAYVKCTISVIKDGNTAYKRDIALRLS